MSELKKDLVSLLSKFDGIPKRDEPWYAKVCQSIDEADVTKDFNSKVEDELKAKQNICMFLALILNSLPLETAKNDHHLSLFVAKYDLFPVLETMKKTPSPRI